MTLLDIDLRRPSHALTVCIVASNFDTVLKSFRQREEDSSFRKCASLLATLFDISACVESYDFPMLLTC